MAPGSGGQKIAKTTFKNVESPDTLSIDSPEGTS